ncbi:MAG: DUF6090 family protein [Bacteroidota bacterium]
MFSRLTHRLGKPNWKYLLTEVLLIVIGINVGLWFNTLSTKRKARQQEREVLEEMTYSLRHDQEVMDEILKIHQDGVEAGNRLVVPKDSLHVGQAAYDLVTLWHYSYFDPDYTSYESLKNYGLRIIRDPGLRRQIVNLYNTRYRAVAEATEYHRQRATAFEPVMVELFDYKDNQYSFRDAGLQSVADQSYRIKGLINSHYYISYQCKTEAIPALDSLLTSVRDYLD